MKVYNLCCEHDHRFEGWFSCEDDFISQSARRLIACPTCNNSDITKMLSAPHLNLSAAHIAPAEPRSQRQAHWLEMAREVIKNTDDVGENFAEEARRIHYNETPQRGIRGVATPLEQEALAEEGINVLPFHMPAALKQSLQ